MRHSILLALLSLALPLSGQGEKVQITPKAKPGEKSVYKLLVNLEIGDMKAEVQSTIAAAVKGVEKDAVTTIGTWSGLKVMVDGEELPMLTASDVTVIAKPDGNISSVQGGIQGSDEVRMYLLTHFVPPPAALKAGEAYKLEFPGLAEKGIPARKYEGVYEGSAQVQGRAGHRFKVKYSEPQAEGMSADLTFIVTSDGLLLRAEGKFANMPVPQVGANAAGSYTIEIQKQG